MITGVRSRLCPDASSLWMKAREELDTRRTVDKWEAVAPQVTKITSLLLADVIRATWVANAARCKTTPPHGHELTGTSTQTGAPRGTLPPALPPRRSA